MGRNKKLLCGSGLFTLAALAACSQTQAQSLDGSLSPGEIGGSSGYALDTVQTNVTTSQNANGGGPSGISNEATASSTGNFTQLSNAYGSITGTGASATLNLFIAGSVTQDADTAIDIALQTNSTGVSSLAGKTINGEANGGNLGDINFDTGFKPNAYIILNTNVDMNGATTTGTYNLSDNHANADGSNSNNFFTDLSGSGAAAPTITGTLNNALVNTPVGTGAAGDPGFAGASTGLEFSISLLSLGYTAGSQIKVLAFPSVGSDNRTDNQILAPFTYNPGDASGGYDYTYYDTNEGGQPGRQFTGVDYIGDQFFSVPEPAGLSLLAVGGVSMLRRRRQAKR